MNIDVVLHFGRSHDESHNETLVTPDAFHLNREPFMGDNLRQYTHLIQYYGLAIGSFVKTQSPITPITSEVASDNNGPPLKAYDIPHVNKDNDNSTIKSNDLHRVRTKCRFKKGSSGSKPKVNPVCREPVMRK
ncbi:hypothetical protein RND71_019528 [Anisodus tanguticus]|uniref:Uncharacterized protein n=1 Tax=Anisodus tanguticus TaxID=243964 RepID=A0AAE1S110_9SOLA|nr:hypothetical protein RND71_019528 [Anisodus tanguticus]